MITLVEITMVVDLTTMVVVVVDLTTMDAAVATLRVVVEQRDMITAVEVVDVVEVVDLTTMATVIVVVVIATTQVAEPITHTKGDPNQTHTNITKNMM